MARFSSLGFTEYAAKIIETLLQGDLYTVKDIYTKTKIPKNKIYESLESLGMQGIVGFDQAKPRKYFIINEGILEELVEKRQKDLLDLKSTIKEHQISKEKIKPQILSIIEGHEEMQKLIQYSNKHVKKEILSCSRLTTMYYECFRTLKDTINRGVCVKFIAIYNGKNYKILKAYHDIGVEIRIYPNKKVFPKIGLFDGKYARITLYKDKSRYKTIWANDPLLYEIVKNHFDTIWKESLPFTPKVS